MLVQDRIIKIEPNSMNDYETILKEIYGSSWTANSSEIGMLMDYKESKGDLKGRNYSEVLETMSEI